MEDSNSDEEQKIDYPVKLMHSENKLIHKLTKRVH